MHKSFPGSILTQYHSRILLLVFVFHSSLTSLAMKEEPFTAVIIGAGVAGISTAARLLENNISDFVILESSDRIGGRIQSVEFGDALVDLGAEHCHGKKGNIVYELQKKFKFLKESPANYNFVYSNGGILNEKLISDINTFVHEFEGIELEDKDEFISIGELFLRLYSKLLRKYVEDPEILQQGTEAIPTLERCACDFEGCNSWLEVPFSGYFEHSEGSHDLHWNGRGYKTIIDIITRIYPNPAKKLPVTQKVKFNKVVSKIKYNSNLTHAIVECEDGSQYFTDHVIFTPSLGILKEKHKTLFEPELPHYKQDCIDKIGYGDIMKVILHFPEKWWHPKVLKEAFVWNKKDKEAVLEAFPAGRFGKNDTWMTGLYLITSVEGNPNVMVAWYIGSIVPKMEKLSDEVIKDGTMVVLRKFFGKDYNVVDPAKVMITRWNSNPHYRGTYCYETVKAVKTERNCFEDLSKPLFNDYGKAVLLFAGEATSPTHFSTVHGSIESGYREADRIIHNIADRL